MRRKFLVNCTWQAGWERTIVTELSWSNQPAT